MELRDFIVTPVYLIIIYAAAYGIRPWVTDSITRQYFFPALTVKLVGAIALGFIYQFYYGGGDTFMYHTHGSRVIWDAFWESPSTGLQLLFTDGVNQQGVYKYSSQIYFFGDSQSYLIIRIATVIDFFTFSAYTATACFFAVFSFIGMWMFFQTFYEQYPQFHKFLAAASFFLPSVFFWGSGILKDTVIVGALGIATCQFYQIFFKHRIGVLRIFLLILSIVLIFSVKKFVLQAYLPAVIAWIVAQNFKKIPSLAFRMLLVPFVVIIIGVSAYYAVMKVGENDPRYSLNKIAETARVTAYDIRYWSGKNAGSGYSLGELDGTFASMVRLTPQAINVSLFRPYLWEVRNPLMALSALESTFFMFFTLYALMKVRGRMLSALSNPTVIFALAFSLSYAFAVGVSTFNFGTLVRYKIPMLPYYLVALTIILSYSRRVQEETRVNFIAQ